MNAANYIVLEMTNDCVLLRDVGPWSKHPTITNDAEQVVEAMAPTLHGRRLEYLDSEGDRSQLLVRDGQFAGFAPASTT